jgi:putative ABC transport system permease protein
VEVDDRYMGGLCTITGILADPPRHSTLQFGFVTATQTNTTWLSSVFTNWVVQFSFHPASNYFLLRPGVDPEMFEQKVQQMIPTYMEEEAVKTNEYRIIGFPQIYLHARSGFGFDWFGDITYVYLFGSVGFIILMIAAINFMNLATARSAGRAREVGLRKTSGAYRSQLIGQFLSESVLTALVAGSLAVLLILLLLPEMNAFAGKEIDLEDSWQAVGLLLVGLSVSVGLLASVYPALFLSAFDPVKVLKGTLSTGAGSASVRKVLVIFQFGISVFLIAGTATVYLQMRHVQSMNLGFDKDLMLITRIFFDRSEADGSLQCRQERIPQTSKYPEGLGQPRDNGVWWSAG